MNTNTNTAPAPSPEPMRLLFLEAMEWGRFFWAQRSVPDITLREVSQDFADKAALSTAAQPHVQIPKENVHDKGDVAKKTEKLDTSGPAVATKEMLVAAVKYANGGDIYEKLPLEVLEIEESIYGEIYWVMAEAAPKATKAEPVQTMAEFLNSPPEVLQSFYEEALGAADKAQQVILDAAAKAEPVQPERVPLSLKQREALAICTESRKVSVSEVQRKLKCGYAQAQELCQSLVDYGGLVDGFQLAPSIQPARKEQPNG